MSTTQTHALSPAERASARKIQAALHPKLNATAFRAACRASREQHGEDRHAYVKVAATHARPDQLA